VAIDLPLGEGPRLAWRARLPASDQSVALGPPVVAGDRVFSLAFRIELQAEVSLCAFSLETGELLWRTPLVRSATSWRFASRRAELDTLDVDKRAREGAPAVRAGVVYACTGAGILAAVDGVSGRVLHSFRYDRVFSLEKDVFDPAYLFDTGGWEHEPVRLFGERVVMAPSDSRFLYMLAPEPGPAGQLLTRACPRWKRWLRVMPIWPWFKTARRLPPVFARFCRSIKVYCMSWSTITSNRKMKINH